MLQQQLLLATDSSLRAIHNAVNNCSEWDGDAATNNDDLMVVGMGGNDDSIAFDANSRAE